MRDFKGDSLLELPSSYTVIDVETTGLDPEHDLLIETAALRVRDSVVVDRYSSLINPGVPISDFISHLTGITNEELSSAPAVIDVLPEFIDFIGDDILVGHNVNFDVNFLYDNIEKHLGKHFTNDYVDTLRLSKRFFKDAPSFKLSFLADYLSVKVDVSHRALSDCETTNQIYQKLVEKQHSLVDEEASLLQSLSFDSSNPFYGKKVSVKGLPQLHPYEFMKAIAEKCGADFGDIFFKDSDFIIFSPCTYDRYVAGYESGNLVKARELVAAGTLTVLSEYDFYSMLGIPAPKPVSKKPLSANDITTSNTVFDETHPLYGKMCVFTGVLERMLRKDAMQIVVDLGGHVGNSVTKKTNYLILGNNDYCAAIKDGKSEKQKKAEQLKLAGQDIEIISENVFYDMIAE